MTYISSVLIALAAIFKALSEVDNEPVFLRKQYITVSRKWSRRFHAFSVAFATVGAIFAVFALA